MWWFGSHYMQGWFGVLIMVLALCTRVPVRLPAASGMGDAPEEKNEGGELITIRVKDQTGEETYFKVKKTTKMDK
jgi:hypothetical protein